MAKDKGYFKLSKLNVKIVHPSRSENAYSYLKSGKAQFITLTLSQALYYRLNGADIVNVMQTGQVNSQILVSHTPLPNIAALKNKKIGVWSDLNQGLIKTIMNRFGINANLVKFNSGVNVFLSNAVDVFLASSYNEYLQLKECGYVMNSKNILRLSDWGYNTPGDGLYTLRSYYEKHPEVVRKFVAASKKGWLYAAKNENDAVNITMKYVRAGHIATNPYHQRLMLRDVLRLQKDKASGKRTFLLSRGEFASAVNFISPGAIKYNDFVK